MMQFNALQVNRTKPYAHWYSSSMLAHSRPAKTGTGSNCPCKAAGDKRHTVNYYRRMKPFRWNPDKNEALRKDRGISFESIVVAIEAGGLRDVLQHPNQSKYPGQRILVVACDDYVYLVPFVEDQEYYFLKTAIPSRKATRDYLRKGEADAEA